MPETYRSAVGENVDAKQIGGDSVPNKVPMTKDQQSLGVKALKVSCSDC